MSANLQSRRIRRDKLVFAARRSIINQAHERRNAFERRGFFIPPRYYTGAITRAITAGNQPTRFAAPPSCAQGIAARTTDVGKGRDRASGEGYEFYRLAYRRHPRRRRRRRRRCRGPLTARRICALNPFYSAARTRAVLMRKSDVLAGPLLFLAAAL